MTADVSTAEPAVIRLGCPQPGCGAELKVLVEVLYTNSVDENGAVRLHVRTGELDTSECLDHGVLTHGWVGGLR